MLRAALIFISEWGGRGVVVKGGGGRGEKEVGVGGWDGWMAKDGRGEGEERRCRDGLGENNGWGGGRGVGSAGWGAKSMQRRAMGNRVRT